MPHGGTLRISATARATRVDIRVEDTGVGIKPEHLGRIFDLYFTTREKGSGIGLSMVYRTVQLHDGEIEVESTEKAYVEAMLEKLEALHPASAIRKDTRPGRPSRGSGPRKRRSKNDTGGEVEASAVDASAIANLIDESEDHTQIEEHIINKRSRLGKVLLAFYFAHRNGCEHISSGDVEKITDELRVRVSQPSASQCISKNRKLFSAGAARKKGKKVPYKLNRQGEQVFTKILAGQRVK